METMASIGDRQWHPLAIASDDNGDRHRDICNSAFVIVAIGDQSIVVKCDVFGRQWRSLQYLLILLPKQFIKYIFSSKDSKINFIASIFRKIFSFGTFMLQIKLINTIFRINWRLFDNSAIFYQFKNFPVHNKNPPSQLSG